jgi:hypothetical protein
MMLVTGAGGFIGSQVCCLLAAQDYAVVAIDRRFATTRPYSEFSGDPGSPEFLAEVIQWLIHAEHPILQHPAEIGERMIWLSTLTRLTRTSSGLSPTRSRGDPEAINSQRFTDEFDYRPVPLREHLGSSFR